MFADGTGGHWWASNFLRDVFRPVTDAAGLPRAFTPYGCRQTMASLLLQRRFSVKVVSERLGHEDIQTTLKHYAHLLPGMQEEAAKTMGSLLGSEKKPESAAAVIRCPKCGTTVPESIVPPPSHASVVTDYTQVDSNH